MTLWDIYHWIWNIYKVLTIYKNVRAWYQHGGHLTFPFSLCSWKDSLNSYGQQFRQYLQTKQSYLTSKHWTLKTWNVKLKIEILVQTGRVMKSQPPILFFFFKKLANKEKMEKLNALHADIMHEHFYKWSKLYKYFIFYHKVIKCVKSLSMNCGFFLR
jgi:hypothetical protein